MCKPSHQCPQAYLQLLHSKPSIFGQCVVEPQMASICRSHEWPYHLGLPTIKAIVSHADLISVFPFPRDTRQATFFGRSSLIIRCCALRLQPIHDRQPDAAMKRHAAPQPLLCVQIASLAQCSHFISLWTCSVSQPASGRALARTHHILHAPDHLRAELAAATLTVILRKNLLYFFNSKRSEVFFRFCTKHQNITMSLLSQAGLLSISSTVKPRPWLDCDSRQQRYELTFCVVYLLGVPPSPLASVHSNVTIHRTPGTATLLAPRCTQWHKCFKAVYSSRYG